MQYGLTFKHRANNDYTRIDGRANDDNNDMLLTSKSKTTQAMYLFKSGKKP